MVVSPEMLAVCAGGVLLASLLRGLTGFGFGLIASPVLSLALPPAQAIPIVMLLLVGSSLVGISTTWREQDRASTLMLSGSALVATPLGVALLAVISPDAARLVIGAACLFGLVLFARGWRMARPPGKPLTVLFGLVAGVLGGLCATPGPPIIAYYLGRQVEPIAARASMILIFLATGSFALLTALFSGLLTAQAALSAALAAPFMVLGTWAGGKLFRLCSERVFRAIATGSLGFVCVAILGRALL